MHPHIFVTNKLHPQYFSEVSVLWFLRQGRRNSQLRSKSVWDFKSLRSIAQEGVFFLVIGETSKNNRSPFFISTLSLANLNPEMSSNLSFCLITIMRLYSIRGTKPEWFSFSKPERHEKNMSCNRVTRQVLASQSIMAGTSESFESPMSGSEKQKLVFHLLFPANVSHEKQLFFWSYVLLSIV